MAYTGELRHSQIPLGKKTSYGPDGAGRDTYIQNINGGFMPEKMACKIDDVSKYSNIFNFNQVHSSLRSNGRVNRFLTCTLAQSCTLTMAVAAICISPVTVEACGCSIWQPTRSVLSITV